MLEPNEHLVINVEINHPWNSHFCWDTVFWHKMSEQTRKPDIYASKSVSTPLQPLIGFFRTVECQLVIHFLWVKSLRRTSNSQFVINCQKVTYIQQFEADFTVVFNAREFFIIAELLPLKSMNSLVLGCLLLTGLNSVVITLKS